jgi:hypothetical protein
MEFIFIAVAALVILVTMFGAYAAYENHCLDVYGKSRSFFLYIVGAILSGILSNGLISHLFLEQICSGDSGAGCVFGVLIVVQPFSLCVGAGIFIYLWVKVNGNATSDLKNDK